MIGCSSQNSAPTGAATTVTSTLDIVVQDTFKNGIGGADIYVNNQVKGQTNLYGESKGHKIILLQGNFNLVRAEKDNFYPSQSNIVSATAQGQQQIVITLEKKRTSLEVNIKDDYQNKVAGATVILHNEDNSSTIKLGVTNEKGLATVDRVSDGKYFLKVSAPGYTSTHSMVEVLYTENKDQVFSLQLIRLPHFDIEVIDNAGWPLDHAEVSISLKEEVTSENTFLQKTYSDSLGRAVLENLLFHQLYVITVKKRGYATITLEERPTPYHQSLRIPLMLD